MPTGLTIYLDGIAQPTPLVYDTLIELPAFDRSAQSIDPDDDLHIRPLVRRQARRRTRSRCPQRPRRILRPSRGTPNTTPITIGETTVFSGDDSGNGNLLLVQDVVLAQPGTLRSLSFYATQASGSLRLGVYDSTGPGGGPGP